MNEKTKPVKRAATTKAGASGTKATTTAKSGAPRAVKPKTNKVTAENATTATPKPVAATRRRKAVEMPKPLLDAGQRAQYVSVAAYYIAERRGFNGGYELADWSQAETEIDNLLREGKLSS